MSADLFAEFGHETSTNQPSKASRPQGVTSQGGSLIPGLDILEDATPSTFSDQLNEPSLLSAQQSTNKNNSTHFDEFWDLQQLQSSVGNDVLFDATLETFSADGSDDWGEFESAEIPAGQVQSRKPVETQKIVHDLSVEASHGSKSNTRPLGGLGLMDSLDFEPRAHNDYRTNTLIGGRSVLGSGNLRSTNPKLPVQEEPFEEWGDFIDGPVEPSQTSNSNPSNTQRGLEKRENLTQTSTATMRKEGGASQAFNKVVQSPPAGHVRPTNIPPPSILLELFPPLLERLRQEGAEAKKDVQRKENLEAVALSIHCTLKTVARVIAGRTLRWKRDAILSQSMRIGPARSGKAGGMKLSTVNKNENIKEQQEAVDVINMWRDRAALFNSVIQAAGRRPAQIIAENTRVMAATAGQGAMKASHACALCGLKRDERIPKVDEHVEDSFGEWWTEHWGHTECRQFWETNMSLLSQR